MKATDLTPEDIAERLRALSLPLFTAELDPTLVGIRAHKRDGDEFDDILAVLWHEAGTLRGILGQGTTDAGRRFRQAPGKAAGVGIVLPGAHRGCWSFGRPQDRGQKAHPYPCGRQVGPIAYIRDADLDGVLDIGLTGWARNADELASLYQAITLGKQIHGDVVFADMHRASATRAVGEIGPYSAMCQVWQDPADWIEVHAQVLRAVPLHGNRHSYVLLDEWGMSR